MTAYGAVNSLRNTIDYILHFSHFSLVDSSPHILQLAYEELNPLHEILEKLDRTRTSKSRKKVNALDGRIKELIWEFEDLLESILYQQILSQSHADQVDEEMKERVWELGGLLESIHRTTTTTTSVPRIMNESEASQSESVEDDVGDQRFSIDLRFLQHNVASLMERLKDMEEEYIYEVDNMPEDDDDQSRSSRSGNKSKLIGLSDQLEHLADKMDDSYANFSIFALVGTAGIGKTALAEAVLKYLTYFEHQVWVTVGRRSQSDDVFRDILRQMFGITHVDDDFGAYLKERLKERLEVKKTLIVLDDVGQMFGITQVDDDLGAYLKERLEGKKTLIVLDDVWERQILDSLVSSLGSIRSGYIHILVTTRDRNTIPPGVRYTKLVRFLNEEESKELLCEKVFGEKDCPFQLDKAATKIAKKCEGLPLTIVTVAGILSKAQNTDPKYWDDVAEMRNSVFMDAYNEISKVLFPSYDYLPQYLKMPFLYLGVFPPDYDIPLSKLMNMLATECWFHNTKKEQSLVNFVLDELCWHKNLALSKERTWETGDAIAKFKTCRLHSSWQYVCRGEARKNKFYHVLKKLVEGLEDGLKGQRCLCLENNLLFGIKEFCNSVRLNCASSARSLLFYGPYHQYPVPIGDDFKLLGKLDALNLRLYTFPTEILTLVLLKYLALTCNGELPTTISKLFNLRVLIVHPHNNIIICGAPSYIPTQIWDMQELEHIEILGKSFVAPSHFASLEKLSTLVGADTNISTILELSRKVPCMRKLEVQIELTPYDDHNDLLLCLCCVSTLGSLETLKCSIKNPVVKYNYAFPSSLRMLPRGLRKLHLSGMGYSWEYMDVIGSLPTLEVLKLRAYAFRGSEWEAQEGSFLTLKFLLIEDSDLMQWKPSFGSFNCLSLLSMKHCYKLEVIHWPSRYHGLIELVDCNPVAVNCVEQLQPISKNSSVQVTVSYSFEEKPITFKFRRYGSGWIP